MVPIAQTVMEVEVDEDEVMEVKEGRKDCCCCAEGKRMACTIDNS